MMRPATRGAAVARAGLLAVALVAMAAGQAMAADSVTRTRLGNGLTVLVRENPWAPVVAVSLQIKMGNRWETRANAGISNLLQLMVVRGTERLTGPQIVEVADRLGGSIDAVGDADSSEISATALARNWREILELVADVALHPSVPQGTFEAVRDFLVRQIRNRGDRPYFVALDTLTARIYGANPYAWDPVGLKESLERIDRNALLEYYRRHYVPGGMVLAVSGQVKTAEVLAQVERLFGGMATGPVPVPEPPRPPAPAESRDVLKVAGAQAQIVMGRLAPSLTDPDYPAVKVLSSILGGGMAVARGLGLLPGPARDRARQRGQGGARPAGTARAHPARAGLGRGAARGEGLSARQPGDGPPHQRAPGLVHGLLRDRGGGP
jgi:zinc protease